MQHVYLAGREQVQTRASSVYRRVLGARADALDGRKETRVRSLSMPTGIIRPCGEETKPAQTSGLASGRQAAVATHR